MGYEDGSTLIFVLYFFRGNMIFIHVCTQNVFHFTSDIYFHDNVLLLHCWYGHKATIALGKSYLSKKHLWARNVPREITSTFPSQKVSRIKPGVIKSDDTIA